MVALIKSMCLVGMLVLVVSVVEQVNGAGECGRSSTPDDEATKLAPCAMAARDPNADVSSSCCTQVKRIGKNPSCLCAAILSSTAKAAGFKPAIAITIPKRCNISDFPVGYKSYTVP
ncbi:hypothetical protein K2173_019659 [Erythroxylum novogranatense]|uniref:Bifunctional inhibitor/plant lipid transfer protein/seed storage helical domain-containing protein n=1 Tax=Erythroxylum novogranatense TaxID=1862640 RepID=A0AAV8UBY2_9ROSI|nr:hypothetical protein K2173_019659 [Erythroxylum novogranatense]